MGKSTFVHADDVMPPREAGKQQAAANKSAGKPSSHNNAKYAKRNGDTHRKKHKKGKNTSLSLEAFARAGKSTYDKREVVKKRRAEMAAKINKFRKVVKRAGDFVEPTEGFDPEEYARKLIKMEDSFIGDKSVMERDEMKQYYLGKKVSLEEVEDDKNKQQRGKKKNTNNDDDDDDDDDKPEEHHGVSKDRTKKRTADEWKMIKSQPERERLQKEKEDREKKFQAEKKIRESKRKERGKLRHSMMKTNSKGQPLMRNRIDAILAKLEKSSS